MSKRGQDVSDSSNSNVEEEEEVGYDDDDDDDDKIDIQLESNIIEVSYSQLIKYSQFIRTKFTISQARKNLSELFQRYSQEYNIQEKSVILFFKFIEDKNAEINVSSFFDLFKLASLFKVTRFNKILQTFEKKNSKDINFIINCLLNRNMMEKFDVVYDESNIDQMESRLVKKINKCLQSEEFNQLPKSTILKIFKKCEKQNIDSNLLYSFIIKSIDERHDLLSLIELEQLSDKNLQDIRNNFLKEQNTPNNDYFQDIGSLVDSIQLLNTYKRNQGIKKEIINEQKEEAFKELEALMDDVNSREIKRRELLNEKDKLSEQAKKNEQKIKEIEKKIGGKINFKKEKQVYLEMVKLMQKSNDLNHLMINDI